MIFFPAIDIYEGFCVRLEKGDFEKKTIFNKNPLDQAKIFQPDEFSKIIQQQNNKMKFLTFTAFINIESFFI